MDKLINWMETRRYNSYLLWLVVGLYLVYLAFQMVSGRVAEAVAPALKLLLALLFALLGVVLAGISLFAILKGHYIENKQHRPTEDGEEENKNG